MNPLTRITSQSITGRELLIAALTGMVMGMLTYVIIRHVEGFIREAADEAVQATGH